MSDSGRVQEFIQGRALATPEELINLKDQVIAFTNDTWPLKITVASPIAYQHAMDYPPPERPIHVISETVQRRGRNNAQMNEAADADDPSPKKGGRNKKGAGAGKQSAPEVDPQLDPTLQPSSNTNTNSNPTQERPEVDDIWSY